MSMKLAEHPVKSVAPVTDPPVKLLTSRLIMRYVLRSSANRGPGWLAALSKDLDWCGAIAVRWRCAGHAGGVRTGSVGESGFSGSGVEAGGVGAYSRGYSGVGASGVSGGGVGAGVGDRGGDGDGDGDSDGAGQDHERPQGSDLLGPLMRMPRTMR
eukprot:6212141-Pleurochrysis_carterae.AAC.3